MGVNLGFNKSSSKSSSHSETAVVTQYKEKKVEQRKKKIYLKKLEIS